MIKQDKTAVEEMKAIDEETRWRAVQMRDAKFNGIFVYAVLSTGIYCKPACASRKPRRERVTFFPSYRDAEAAGFRACRRCQPQNISVRDPQTEMVIRACRLIEESSDGPVSLAKLGTEIGVSPHHLQRTFKSITGVTPRQYAAAHRLEQFKTQIRKGEDVTNAIYDAGYGSSSRLYEKAPEQLGMTPKTYARGGRGMNINYTIADSPLGKLLVATTERGICAVTLGDSETKLEASLKSEYPNASIRLDTNETGKAIERLLSYLGGDKRRLDLPLDLQATAFQLSVWEELRRIPYGSTRSYSEIAEGLGQPKAVRAVARACATNPVALITPCHRVVRADGSLSGYRWGIERKAKLLAREQATKESR
jgi:AraC family transcriptional regulator of adaptative response/methylated-DNA-[protein]-cysteine methyltransferase